MIAWHDDFCADLAAQWLLRRALRQPRRRPLDARRRLPADDAAAAPARLSAPRATTLERHGHDAAALLDALEFERAHLVGASMGG